jgi:hypothetical protein
MENKQLEDAKKSRSELLRACLDLNLIREAEQYVDSEESRGLLLSIHERRERLK